VTGVVATTGPPGGWGWAPPTDSFAFGDNLNDLEMIQAAGLGVAMGNAHADLKRAARLVAPSNDEDGVAAVLWTHVLGA
jgi:hypothetical protein